MIATAFVILAVLIAYFLLRKTDRLLEENYVASIGCLYSELRIESKWALSYNIIFLLRRAINALMLSLLSDYCAFQVMTLTLMSLFMIMYLMLVRPFQDPKINNMDIFNECTVLVCNMHLFVFASIDSSLTIHYFAGWSMLFLTGLSLMINMAIALTISMTEIKKRLCRLRLMKRSKKYEETF